MSSDAKKRSKWPIHTGTGPVRRFVVKDGRVCELPRTRATAPHLPPPAASGDADWLWAELPPLREWLAKNSATLGTSLDVDQVLRQVVEARRPHLGATPPREYLRGLAEKLILLPA